MLTIRTIIGADKDNILESSKVRAVVAVETGVATFKCASIDPEHD